MREFWAPYVFGSFPDDYDAFEHAAVVADKAPLRERPEAGAPVVATLSYDIVKVDQAGSVYQGDDFEQPLWIKATTLQGATGYLEPKDVRSPADYRAAFKKVRGRWVMTAVVAGD